jgi:hypothetical protein
MELKTLFRRNKHETPSKKSGRVRNFFKMHKKKFAQLGSVALVFALVGFGSISPPLLPEETSKRAREQVAELSETPLGKRLSDEQKEYLCEILTNLRHTSMNGHIDSILKHHNFEPFMLEYLGIVVLEQSYDWWDTQKNIMWFREILDFHGLRQYMVNAAIEDYDSKKGEVGVHLHEHIKYASLGTKMVRHIRENFGKDYKLVLEGMKVLSENPNFQGKDGMIAALHQVGGALQSMKGESDPRSKEMQEALNSYYSNPNFGKNGHPNEWESTHTVRRIYTLITEFSSLETESPGLLSALLKNPNFSLKDLDENLEGKLEKILDTGDGERSEEVNWQKELSWQKIRCFMKSPLFYPSMLEHKNELWLGKFINRNKKGVEQQKGSDSLYAFTTGEYARGGYEYPGGFYALYRDGKRMAKKLGAKKSSSTYLNFAYAISEIGPEMTKRMYMEFGIEHFVRYAYRRNSQDNPDASSLLKIAVGNIENHDDERPIFLIATGEADWNGAFRKIDYNTEEFEKSFRIMIVESGGDIELIKRITHVGAEYGKVALLILSGHGDAKGIRLGSGRNGGNKLDAGDLEKMGKLRHSFASRSQIVLYSCSTGALDKGGIGHAIARAVKGTEVFAPKHASTHHRIEFDPVSKRINTVEYNNNFVQIATNKYNEMPPPLPIEKGFGGIMHGESPQQEQVTPTNDELYMYIQQEKQKNSLILMFF